jgi:hypothetical protein
MPTSFWRSPDAANRLNRLDRSGFAVEFLRRNADYRHDYTQTRLQIARGQTDSSSARSSLARRWGLSFRL